MDPDLVVKAIALTVGAALGDAEAAATYRARYPEPPANAPPKAIACDTATGDTYWHGDLLGRRVRDWFALMTDGRGAYCMMQQTDSATIAAIFRFRDAGPADPKRILVLRGASRFDRQYPGQTAYDSLDADAGGASLALSNLLLAGAPFVEEIIANWADWRNGVPR